MTAKTRDEKYEMVKNHLPKELEYNFQNGTKWYSFNIDCPINVLESNVYELRLKEPVEQVVYVNVYTDEVVKVFDDLTSACNYAIPKHIGLLRRSKGVECSELEWIEGKNRLVVLPNQIFIYETLKGLQKIEGTCNIIVDFRKYYILEVLVDNSQEPEQTEKPKEILSSKELCELAIELIDIAKRYTS